MGDRPLLIIVGGAPASGKTTLATIVAQELHLPLLTKDLIKEALFDSLGSGNREWSGALSRAAYAVLYSVAARLLDVQTSLVLEANFRRGTSEPEIRRLAGTAMVVQLFCHTTLIETLRRYSERTSGVTDRHSGHDDASVSIEAASWFANGTYDALDLDAPRLRVETTSGYDPEVPSIVRWLTSFSPLLAHRHRDTLEGKGYQSTPGVERGS